MNYGSERASLGLRCDEGVGPWGGAKDRNEKRWMNDSFAVNNENKSNLRSEANAMIRVIARNVGLGEASRGQAGGSCRFVVEIPTLGDFNRSGRYGAGRIRSTDFDAN